MTGNKKSIRITWAIPFILGLAFLFCPAVSAVAKSNIVEMEGVSYNVNSSLKDNLKSLIGKHVYVTLKSGKAFAGIIKDVGEHLVHVEKIVGKDFFDALILLGDISAIDTKFRDYQR
jgi:hypothetical protein